MRLLRTFRHMATKDHFCDNCGDFIHPGQFYEGQVFAKDSRIRVTKQHIDPLCDPSDDFFEEMEKLEKLEAKTTQLKAAA